MPRFIAFLYPFLSMLTQLLVSLLLGLALLPSFLFLRWSWQQLAGSIETFWAALIFCLALGFSYVLFGNALLVVIVLVRTIFRVRNRERKGQVFSLDSVTTGLNNLLLKTASMFYLPMLTSGYFNVWFYRAMGAKIGRATIIATHRLWDCDLIEIGDNCIIGGNSSISAHYAKGARGRTRRVRIGNSVTIGANTAVMPGVVIEDNVVVGGNSLVPLGKRLKSGGIYVGVPVVKVN